MASNMIWSHQIVHYLQMGHFNKNIFILGLLMSIFTGYFLLRSNCLLTKKNG